MCARSVYSYQDPPEHSCHTMTIVLMSCLAGQAKKASTAYLFLIDTTVFLRWPGEAPIRVAHPAWDMHSRSLIPHMYGPLTGLGHRCSFQLSALSMSSLKKKKKKNALHFTQLSQWLLSSAACFLKLYIISQNVAVSGFHYSMSHCGTYLLLCLEPEYQK